MVKIEGGHFEKHVQWFFLYSFSQIRFLLSNAALDESHNFFNHCTLKFNAYNLIMGISIKLYIWEPNLLLYAWTFLFQL
jgi:hypothetical protein